MTPAVTATPCAKCPFRVKFRGDDDYLRVGRRAGIVRSLLSGADFPCHETVEHVDEDCDGETDECVTGGVTCAGASLMMLRAGHEGPLKFAARLGMVDLNQFEDRNRDVELWTLRECLDEGRASIDEFEDEETEGTCNVVNGGCEAPAGYLIGGEAVPGDVMIDTRCPVCGEFVCDTCSDDDGKCLNEQCSEDEVEW